VVTSVPETEEKNKIIIYPNPVIDVLIIDTQNILNKGELVTIINVAGKVVFSKPLENNVEAVNIAGLSNGVYFVKTGMYMQKFIKGSL
jgi:hypothetical protein